MKIKDLPEYWEGTPSKASRANGQSSEHLAWRRGFTAGLEKAAEDLSKAEDFNAPPDRKIVRIHSDFTSCVDSNGDAWKLVYTLDEKSRSSCHWARLPALPQGEST